MKSITFKELVNQLNDPDFSHTYLISDNFDGAGLAEASSHYVFDDETVEFYFENFEMVTFSRHSMNAKTDGSSIFLVDTNGISYELRLFKTVQMTF